MRLDIEMRRGRGWQNPVGILETKKTERFEEVPHTRDMPTSALNIANSQKDFSSIKTASGGIIEVEDSGDIVFASTRVALSHSAITSGPLAHGVTTMIHFCINLTRV